MPSQQHQAQTFGDWAYLAIAKHYKKILHHEAGVLADLDPEELHQMRVGMRRLRSALVGFSPALNLTENMSQKAVGKCGQILGKLRDLDVMQMTFTETYLPHLSETETKILQVALEKLKKQRQKQLKKVRNFLDSKFYLSVKDEFATWLEQPKYQAIATVEIQLVLADLLLPQLSELLLHEGWWVGYAKRKISVKKLDEIFVTQSEILHDLRKSAKRSRYNMELFQEFYGEDYTAQLHEIKQVQSLIGHFQDDAVLSAFLSQTLGENFAKELPTVAKIFAEHRHKTWQKWTKLQHQFLDSQYRLNLHQTICQPQLNSLVFQ